jgi:DNA invertase Pin-like site-specific DNA recombinase
MPPANAVIYTRRQAAANPQTVDDQIRECCELSQQEGVRVTRMYHDVGSANAPLDTRPGLKALLKDAQRGKFNTVLVTGLDRLSRDNWTLSAMVNRLSSLNVRIVATSGADQWWSVPYFIINIVAEFNRRSHAEMAARLNAEVDHQ